MSSTTPVFTGIEAVTLDFYETLVHPRATRGRGQMLMDYLESCGLETAPWEHQVLYDVFEPHLEEYDPRGPEEERRRYRERLARRVLERLEVQAPDDAAAEHAGEIWRILGPPCLSVFPDVPGTLQRLVGAGLPLAVVSNWQRGLVHFLTELGLAGAFDHVVVSAEVGSAKPDPGIFQEACRRLGVEPRRTLHVGDRKVDDVAGARDAGLQVVRVARGRVPTEPLGTVEDVPGDEPTIPDLAPLPGILGLDAGD